MRVAFAGDWHGNAYWATQAIEYASAHKAEVIVHLGDYGYDFYRSFRNSVESTLRRVGLELVFVDGNHENFNWLYDKPIEKDGRRRISPRVHHLPRGYRWIWDDVRFLALGGAVSVDKKWRQLDVSWWTQETLTDEEIATAVAGGPVDVLVSHDCPAGFRIPGLSDNPPFPPEAILESEAHRIRLSQVVDVVQPRFVFHGHYHVSYTRTVNFDYGPCNVYGLDCDGSSERTNVLVMDTAELKQETVDVAEPTADQEHDHRDAAPVAS